MQMYPQPVNIHVLDSVADLVPETARGAHCQLTLPQRQLNDTEPFLLLALVGVVFPECNLSLFGVLTDNGIREPVTSMGLSLNSTSS